MVSARPSKLAEADIHVRRTGRAAPLNDEAVAHGDNRDGRVAGTMRLMPLTTTEPASWTSSSEPISSARGGGSAAAGPAGVVSEAAIGAFLCEQYHTLD